MPLVQIFMRKSKSAQYKQAVCQSVYQAMRETFNVPENDQFMIISELDADNFIYSKNYLGVERTDDLMIIQITANNTRHLEQKKAFYSKMASLLESHVSIRPEDIFINIIEVAKENWSFGQGIAQYA